MEKSPTITELAKALAAFQVKAEKIIKRADNPFFKSKYADLPAILDEINIPLKEAGLVISQWPDGEGLTTLLIHAQSGEYIEANAIMHPTKNDPQSIGSAITYQRRYSICSILCLNVDEDDDGNEASFPPKMPAEQPNKPWLNKGTEEFTKAKNYYDKAADKEAALKYIRTQFAVSKATQLLLEQ